MVATMPVNGHRQSKPAIAETAANEIGRRDVVVLAADVPEPREHQEQDRINDDRVRHREERDRAGTKGERRDGDESVGGIEIAADQEPGDDGAETPAAKTPFVQQIEVTLTPMRGDKTEPRDKGEQRHEDDQSGPVNLLHDSSPGLFFGCPATATQSIGLPMLGVGREINDCSEHGPDDHPQQLIPIKER